MLKRVEWLAVLAAVLVLGAWFGFATALLTTSQTTLVILTSIVSAVLSLRSR